MTPSSTRSRRLWAFALAMALVGAFVGYGFGYWLKHARGVTAFPDWTDAGALLLAFGLIGQGAFVLALSLSSRAAGRAFGGEEGRAATPAQLSFYRQQAGVLLLAGVMLGLPVVASLIATGPLPQNVSIAVMAAIALCFIAQTALNIIVWRRADEFVRRLISETSSLCFWVLQAALFLWAAGERLSLLPQVSAWTCVVVLMGVYLAASAFISTRNGASA